MLQRSLSRCAVHILIIVASVTSLPGCGNAATGYYPTEPTARPPANAFVLDRAQLGDFEGSILEAMIGRVPGLRVDQSAACPAVALRGHINAVPGISDPQVYVDGARTMNTCILELVHAGDVERVEIYPSGVTSRPGYVGNAHGLILIFLRDS